MESQITSKTIIDKYGNQIWHVNNIRHRIDGPAVIYPDGYKEWYVGNKRHRLDGPAVIDSNGYEEWWVDDKHVDPDFISRYIRHNPPTKKE